MAGNSQRRGRTSGAGKKTATAGTGGKNRRSLAGRGATPPAEMRKGHPAQRKAQADARRRTERDRSRQRAEETPELLLGRNPVVEALRAQIPATAAGVPRSSSIAFRNASGNEVSWSAPTRSVARWTKDSMRR